MKRVRFVRMVSMVIILAVIGVGFIQANEPNRSCEIRTTCQQGEVGLLRLSGLTNAHAALMGEDIDYSHTLCCNFGQNVVSIGDETPILRLSDKTNAHAEFPSQNNYKNFFNLSLNPKRLYCTYNEECTQQQQCLMSLSTRSGSEKSNLHFGECYDDPYETKVCCQVVEECRNDDGQCPLGCSIGNDNDCGACSVKRGCDSGENTILLLSDLTDAHAELPGGDAGYEYAVCCDFGQSVSLSRETGTHFLTLATVSDSHAEIPETAVPPSRRAELSYEQKLFLHGNPAPMDCTYKTECAQSESCLLSLSTRLSGSFSNLHLGDCITDPYETKVCCSVTRPCSNDDTICPTGCNAKSDNDCPTCLFKTACSLDETSLLQFSGRTDAHVQVPQTDREGYPYELCCGFDDNVFSSVQSGQHKLLSLSAQTDAHLEFPKEALPTARHIELGYDIPLFIDAQNSLLSCNYKSACAEDEECLLTISTNEGSVSDLHAGDCVTDPYETAVCCKIAPIICGNGPDPGESCADCFEDFCVAGQQCHLDTDQKWNCRDRPRGGGSGGGGTGGGGSGSGRDRIDQCDGRNPNGVCSSTEGCDCIDCQVRENAGIYTFPTQPERNPCGNDFTGPVCTERGICDCIPGNPRGTFNHTSCQTIINSQQRGKSSFHVEADNVVTISKIVNYKGEPVKVNIAVWD